MTIAADRIERFAVEAAKLGCKVEDEVTEHGRRVHVSGAHWMDTDSVIVSLAKASAKVGSNRRDSLHCIIFSTRKFPRKHYGVVEFHEAMAHVESLKDYSAHTHCRPGHHVCDEPRCQAPADHREDGKPCGIPRSLHTNRLFTHAFTS